MSSRPSARRLGGVLSAVLCLVLLGSGPAGAGGEPLPPRLDVQSSSLMPYAGLNLTMGSVLVNPNPEPLHDVYVEVTAGPSGNGLAMLPESRPSCAQPDGPGSAVVCGPLTVPGDGFVHLLDSSRVPSDYLRTHGRTPLVLTARVTGARLGGAPVDVSDVPPRTVSMSVLTSPGAQVALGRTIATSPGESALRLIVANGGWSWAQLLTASQTFPPGLRPHDLPAGCTAEPPSDAGTEVTCVWEWAPSARQREFRLPFTMPQGHAPGTAMQLPDPSLVQTSDLDPPGERDRWVGQVVGRPFSVRIVSSRISGTVYEDVDGDGVPSPDDRPLPSRLVRITGGYSFGPDGLDQAGGGDDVPVTVAIDATSGADGGYALDGLMPGRYELTLVPPEGGSVVWRPSGSVLVDVDADVTGQDFGVALGDPVPSPAPSSGPPPAPSPSAPGPPSSPAPTPSPVPEPTPGHGTGPGDATDPAEARSTPGDAGPDGLGGTGVAVLPLAAVGAGLLLLGLVVRRTWRAG